MAVMREICLRQAQRRGYDLQLAEDAVQFTFMKMSEFWAADRYPKNLFITIFRNALFDLLRKKKVRSYVPIENKSIPDHRQTSQENLELTRELSEAMSKLTPEQQMLLNYRLQDGLSYKQIARKMGTNVPTVTNRLHAAKKKLLSLLFRKSGPASKPNSEFHRSIGDKANFALVEALRAVFDDHKSIDWDDREEPEQCLSKLCLAMQEVTFKLCQDPEVACAIVAPLVAKLSVLLAEIEKHKMTSEENVYVMELKQQHEMMIRALNRPICFSQPESFLLKDDYHW